VIAVSPLEVELTVQPNLSQFPEMY